MAANVERNSDHPLANSLVEGAKEQELEFSDVNDFDSVTGGVYGTVEGKSVLIGKRGLLKERDVTNLAALDEKAGDLQSQGNTVMFVAIDGSLAGIIAVSDPIKTLHELGLRIIMLTGDNEKTAKSVATELGIDDFEAGTLPEGKHDRIKALKSEGHKVAMAGDGNSTIWKTTSESKTISTPRNRSSCRNSPT